MKMSPLQKSAVGLVSRLHTGIMRLVGGKGFLARNCLILTTRGRKTGRQIPTPLLYVAEGEKLFVVGSFGGNDHPPQWYLNLSATPEVTVEVEGRAGRYHARTIAPDEKARVWPKLLAIYSAYDSYQQKTTRVIPVVELAPL